MSDLIDRQAAIQTALEFIIEYLGGAFDEDFQKKLIERMSLLPSVQQWIPCNERLPKKDEEVFVYLFRDSPYIAWHDGVDWRTEDFAVDKDEEPLAWMPLPEAWKGCTENE